MALNGPVVPRLDILGLYFKDIKQHELLTREQEIELVHRYRDRDDDDAGRQLVQSNLRLVIKIAKEFYSGTDRYSLNDLIQQGNVGLIQAVRKFEPARRTKLSYYASFWIKAYIYKYLLDNYSSVKIGKTQAQRKLFFNLRKTKEKLKRQGLAATPEQIARTLGVKVSAVKEMQTRMQNNDQSLNAPSRMRDNEELLDNLEAQNDSAEDRLGSRQLVRMLREFISQFKSHLNLREREILERRIVAQEPLTLQKLGDQFGVSRERIRQIEARIIRNLKQYLKSEIPDFQFYLAG